MSLDGKILQILDNSACLSKGQLGGYLSRSLYPEELRAVELHLSECPFCSDALDGFEAKEAPQALLTKIDKLPSLPSLPPRESKVEAVLDKVVKTVVSKAPVAKSQVEPVSQTRNMERSYDKGQLHTTKGSNIPAKANWLKPLGIAAGLLAVVALLWYFRFNKEHDQKVYYADNRPVPHPGIAKDDTSPESVQGPLAQSMPLKEDTALSQIEKPVGKDTAVVHATTVTGAAKEQSGNPPAKSSSEDAADAKTEMSKSAPVAAMKIQKTDTQTVPEPEKETLARSAGAEKKTAKQDDKMSDYEIGLELYKQKQYGSALLYLRPAQRNNADPKHYDAVYYSALCYKNSGQEKKAVQLFKKLVEEGAPQKSSAQKQLKELGED